MNIVTDYPIEEIGTVVEIELPGNAKIVAVGDDDGGDLVLCAQANDSASPETRRFIVIPSGEEIVPIPSGGDYASINHVKSCRHEIATVPTWCHLFEVIG